jgi:hypothetical protein
VERRNHAQAARLEAAAQNGAAQPSPWADHDVARIIQLAILFSFFLMLFSIAGFQWEIIPVVIDVMVHRRPISELLVPRFLLEVVASLLPFVGTAAAVWVVKLIHSPMWDFIILLLVAGLVGGVHAGVTEPELAEFPAIASTVVKDGNRLAIWAEHRSFILFGIEPARRDVSQELSSLQSELRKSTSLIQCRPAKHGYYCLIDPRNPYNIDIATRILAYKIAIPTAAEYVRVCETIACDGSVPHQ